MARKPYRLLKRGPYWYYKLPHEKAFHSTKQTTRVKAEKYVLNLVGQDKPPDILLEDYTKTFFKWSECDWVRRQHAKGRRFSESVAKHRRAHLDNYILKQFGKRLLTSLNKVDIENWLVSLKLANQTKNHILYTFRIVLREAEQQHYITANPLEKIEAMGKTSRPRDVFTWQEIRALFPKDRDGLLKIWGNSKYAACFMILASTGIRSGEVRALRWEDVLPEGALYIHAAVKDDDQTIGETKTGDSRVVLLPTRTQEVLSWWKTEAAFRQHRHLIVSGAQAVKPLSRQNLSRQLTAALETAEIELAGRKLVVHSFRHFFNTYMRKVLPEEILRRMTGHHTAEMTELYDHPTPQDMLARLEPSRRQIEGMWGEAEEP